MCDAFHIEEEVQHTLQGTDGLNKRKCLVRGKECAGASKEDVVQSMPAGMHLLRRLKFFPPSPPSFFWFSTFSAKKRTKVLLCLKFGHKKKYLKGASKHLVHERVLFLQGRGKLSE